MARLDWRLGSRPIWHSTPTIILMAGPPFQWRSRLQVRGIVDVRNTWLWQPREGTRQPHWITRTRLTRRAWDSSHYPAPCRQPEQTYQGFYNTDSNLQDRTVMHQGGGLVQVTQDLQFAIFKSTPRGGLPQFPSSIRTPAVAYCQFAYLWPGQLDCSGAATRIARGQQGSVDRRPFFLPRCGRPRAPTSAAWRRLRSTCDNRRADNIPIPTQAIRRRPLTWPSKRISVSLTAGLRYTDDRRSIGGTTSAEGVGVLASETQSADSQKGDVAPCARSIH